MDPWKDFEPTLFANIASSLSPAQVWVEPKYWVEPKSFVKFWVQLKSFAKNLSGAKVQNFLKSS